MTIIVVIVLWVYRESMSVMAWYEGLPVSDIPARRSPSDSFRKFSKYLLKAYNMSHIWQEVFFFPLASTSCKQDVWNTRSARFAEAFQ
jgi:hypothetical protein